MFTYRITPSPMDSINLLRREEQVTIFRLRCQQMSKWIESRISGLRLSLVQAWKKCRSRDLGSDKTADFGIKFGEDARISRIKLTFWVINRMG